MVAILGSILVGVLVRILVAVLILSGLILIGLVLVIHDEFLRQSLFYGDAVMLGYPVSYDLSLALKIMLTMQPAVMAAVIPPAVAFSPPVSIPIHPSSVTALRTPFAIA